MSDGQLANWWPTENVDTNVEADIVPDNPIRVLLDKVVAAIIADDQDSMVGWVIYLMEALESSLADQEAIAQLLCSVHTDVTYRIASGKW